MKKKNLILLLLFPFIIALLGIVTMNLTFNLIDSDILGIQWDYQDMEAFKVNQRYLLEAVGVDQNKYPVESKNQLHWSLKNKDSHDINEYAKIVQENNRYYLYTLNVGEIIISCSNFKGNVSKSFHAVIYENGVIILNPKIKGSQNNIDENIYYGEYDLVNNQKKNAKIEYTIETIPKELKSLIQVKESSSNINFSLLEETITILDSGKASLTLGYEDIQLAKDVTLNFNIVDEGVNVYTYQDLLYCTNQSAQGEIVVLRKSFESLENTFLTSGEKKDNNIELFGNYNKQNKTFNFDQEVYRFETNFNAEYIQQWNEFIKNNSNYYPISNQVIVGLHVQKDFYGNGYTLNFHNLAYPYDEKQVTDTQGNTHIIPALRKDNLFRGPLPFYTLGDPNNMPLITAFGQDNIGFYVHGENITINDVMIKNCDFGNNLANLDYTGTVVEINGKQVTIANSKLANGKNVVRSFSSMDVVLKNCLLSYARNFLIETGANEYEKVQDAAVKNFTLLDQTSQQTVISDFLKKKGTGDQILNQYLTAAPDNKEIMRQAINSIHDALNDDSLIQNQFKGSMEIKDCYFYQSGIASIALESLFNGPYLYSNAPSTIGDMFSEMNYENRPLVPLEPTNVSGVSYPVKVILSGKTTFYDYKRTDKLDLTGLISENISTIANSMGQEVRKITIDDIFPLKSLLYKKASQYLYSVIEDQSSYQYINVPIAYYGGGANLSIVDDTHLDSRLHFSNVLDINLLDNYLDLPTGTGLMQQMKNLMLKTVTTVIGYAPFKFICLNGKEGYLFNETPKISDLIENAKEDVQ